MSSHRTRLGLIFAAIVAVALAMAGLLAATSQAAPARTTDSAAVTDLEEFGDRGHSLTIDSGWREVADACLAWLGKQGL